MTEQAKGIQALSHIIQSGVAGLAGIVAAEPRNQVLSVGRILQATVGRKFWEQLKEEWDTFSEQGRIKKDYTETNQHAECLRELVDYLENTPPEQITFEFLKKLFLVAASESKSTRDDILPKEYLQTARTLNAKEVLLLQACREWRGFNFQNGSHTFPASSWIQAMAQQSPLKHRSLVEIAERSLHEKGLVGGRVHNDRSGIEITEHGVLTTYAADLLDYVAAYESLKPTNTPAQA